MHIRDEDRRVQKHGAKCNRDMSQFGWNHVSSFASPTRMQCCSVNSEVSVAMYGTTGSQLSIDLAHTALGDVDVGRIHTSRLSHSHAKYYASFGISFFFNFYL